ncbi:hypothetical protein RSO01_85860 [Reyranella soli]|uniref:Uncharacterized protein n=1 Tax=Reyranella soli TaxID=1230389 RepID=A0A512NR36_9HYPH|nr:hypothetical protein RSO01_85860 [Reyranella soli]
MGEYCEVYVAVAFDMAKLKHAAAIAEGGREGEIRCVGEIENRPVTIEWLIKTRDRRNMGFIRRCRGVWSVSLVLPFSTWGGGAK